MTTPDALALFRQSISASITPTLLTAASEPCDTLQLATYISFPSTSPATNFTKETPTRYTSKADSKDEFYSVGQVWLAWTEKDAGVRDYLMKGQAGGIGYVGIADRRGLVEYLQDDSDGGTRIASSTKAEGRLCVEERCNAKLTEVSSGGDGSFGHGRSPTGSIGDNSGGWTLKDRCTRQATI